MTNRITFVGELGFCHSLAANPTRYVNLLQAELRNRLKQNPVIACLECAITDAPPPGLWERNPLGMVAPRESIGALCELNVAAVSLANNHTLDAGVPGFVSTLQTLKQAGIMYFGAGMDLATAGIPAFLELEGGRLALLGFGECPSAARRRPGVYPLHSGGSLRLIREVRKQCDWLAVCFHEGIEVCNYPTRSTRAICHRVVEAGADLVVGSHPHTVQGIEYYRGVPIAYSLGNFIFPNFAPEVFDFWWPQIHLVRCGRPVTKYAVRREMLLECEFLPGRRVECQGTPLLAEESTCAPFIPSGGEMQECTAFLEQISEALQKPDDVVWREQDQIESEFKKRMRGAISLTDVLRNLHKIRLRHIGAYLRLWV